MVDVKLRPCVACGNDVSTQASACPKCGQPVAQAAAQAVAKIDGSKVGCVAIGGGVLLLVAAMIVINVSPQCGNAVISAASHSDTKSVPAPTVATTPATPADAQQEARDSAARSMGATSDLDTAIQLALPYMTDESNSISSGAYLMVFWAAGHRDAFFAGLNGLPETRYGEALKDPSVVRGERLCASGVVNQITARHQSGVTAYEGGLFWSYGAKIVRFLAIGDAAGVEQDRRARVCGVFIGIYEYANTGGGTTIAPFVVGGLVPAN